jgi:hypothetical protein
MANVMRFVAAALVTAPVSGCASGFVTMVSAAGSAPAENLGLIWAVVAIGATLISFPALLLLAAPLTVPFLAALPNHRRLALPAFALVGALLSLPVAMIAGADRADTLLPAMTTGAIAGCVWVLVLDWLHDPDPA